MIGSDDASLCVSKGELHIPRDHCDGVPYKGTGTWTDSTHVNEVPCVWACDVHADWEVCKGKGFSDYVFAAADSDQFCLRVWCRCFWVAPGSDDDNCAYTIGAAAQK